MPNIRLSTWQSLTDATGPGTPLADPRAGAYGRGTIVVRHTITLPNTPYGSDPTLSSGRDAKVRDVFVVNT